MSQKKRLLWLIILIMVTIVVTITASSWAFLSFWEEHQKAQELDRQEQMIRLHQVLRSDDHCYAPCWQGLIPGQSRQADYQRFVETATRQGYYLRHESQISNNKIQYTWVNDESDLVIFISMVDDTLVYIDIAGLRSVKGSMLLYALGPPSHYSSEWVRDIGATVSTHFYYEDKGIYIKFNGVDPRYYVDDNCRLMPQPPFSLTANNPLLPLEVWRLYFVEPNSSYEMRANAFGEELVRGTVFRKWDGLDNIIVSNCFR
jgi:hypothetical protein